MNPHTTSSCVEKSTNTVVYNVDFLETLVYEWIRRSIYYGYFRLTYTVLVSIASKFKSILKLKSFKPSRDWVPRFRQTYNLPNDKKKYLDIGYTCSKSVEPEDIFKELQPEWAKLDPTKFVAPSLESKSADEKEEHMDIEEELPVCTIFGRKTIQQVAKLINPTNNSTIDDFTPMVVCSDPKSKTPIVSSEKEANGAISQPIVDDKLMNSSSTANMLDLGLDKSKGVVNKNCCTNLGISNKTGNYLGTFLKEVIHKPAQFVIPTSAKESVPVETLAEPSSKLRKTDIKAIVSPLSISKTSKPTISPTIENIQKRAITQMQVVNESTNKQPSIETPINLNLLNCPPKILTPTLNPICGENKASLSTTNFPGYVIKRPLSPIITSTNTKSVYTLQFQSSNPNSPITISPITTNQQPDISSKNKKSLNLNNKNPKTTKTKKNKSLNIEQNSIQTITQVPAIDEPTIKSASIDLPTNINLTNYTPTNLVPTYNPVSKITPFVITNHPESLLTEASSSFITPTNTACTIEHPNLNEPIMPVLSPIASNLQLDTLPKNKELLSLNKNELIKTAKKKNSQSPATATQTLSTQTTLKPALLESPTNIDLQTAIIDYKPVATAMVDQQSTTNLQGGAIILPTLVSPTNNTFTLQCSTTNENPTTTSGLSPITTNLQSNAFVQPTALQPIIIHFHTSMPMQPPIPMQAYIPIEGTMPIEMSNNLTTIEDKPPKIFINSAQEPAVPQTSIDTTKQIPANIQSITTKHQQTFPQTPTTNIQTPISTPPIASVSVPNKSKKPKVGSITMSSNPSSMTLPTAIPPAQVMANLTTNTLQKSTTFCRLPSGRGTRFANRKPLETLDEVVQCIKLMEDFAMMNDNFRLIGFLERLERQIYPDMKK